MILTTFMNQRGYLFFLNPITFNPHSLFFRCEGWVSKTLTTQLVNDTLQLRSFKFQSTEYNNVTL